MRNMRLVASTTPAFRRGAITFALVESVAASKTLLAWMIAYVDTLGKDSMAGRSTAQVSANAISAGFHDPKSSGMSQYDSVEMWQELTELHTKAAANLGGTPTDAQIAAEMQALLRTPMRLTVEFSGMQQW